MEGGYFFNAVKKLSENFVHYILSFWFSFIRVHLLTLYVRDVYVSEKFALQNFFIRLLVYKTACLPFIE